MHDVQHNKLNGRTAVLHILRNSSNKMIDDECICHLILVTYVLSQFYLNVKEIGLCLQNRWDRGKVGGCTCIWWLLSGLIHKYNNHMIF